ncbi:MAG: FAD-binding protein [Candidatus Thermoplasmatota archaeon]|nr:FAD-binding protein [Candidatus Thermoplasmatota archaeon]
MNLHEAAEMAKKETHCGMCKVDFLGTGLCPAGLKHGFVAYWPEGRMELVQALAAGTVPPTQALVDIVNSCTMCGICDRQCHFITHLRPMKAQQALKTYAENLKPSDIRKIPEDAILRELRTVVGNEWATNDPIVSASYAKSIITDEHLGNFYVVMPQTAEEVAQVVKIANTHKIPFMPRGNGTFLAMAMQTLLMKGVSLERGMILDLRRMKKLQIHPKSWTATIGPGVTAFELQKAAYAHQMRALVAEAEAHVCVNVATFGPISTWGNTYGWGSDNFIDVELVNNDGAIVHQNDKEVKNPYATDNSFTNLTLTPSHIVTEMTVKLYPVFEDEYAVFVPFEHLQDALDLALVLAKRKIGLSLAIISSKYLSEFISPTNEIAEDVEYVMSKHLKMKYVVDVVCDTVDKKRIEELAKVTMDSSMMKTLMLGAPKLASLKDSEFLKVLSEEKDPLNALFAGPMKTHLEQGLEASPEKIAQAFDPDLQGFYKKVYEKPEMTDAVWLHAFRILPSRLQRQKMFMVRGGFMAAEKDLILSMTEMLHDVGKKHHLVNALGFIGFIEHGKLAFLEYDYYYDHTKPEDHVRLNQGIVESLQKTLAMDHVIPVEYVLHKGLYRKEHFFYPLPKGLSEKELQIFGELVHTIAGG